MEGYDSDPELYLWEQHVEEGPNEPSSKSKSNSMKKGRKVRTEISLRPVGNGMKRVMSQNWHAKSIHARALEAFNEVEKRRPPSLLKQLKKIFLKAARAFAITYGIRTGISVLLRLIYIVRNRPAMLRSLTLMFSEENFKFRVPAVRMAGWIGTCVGLYEGTVLIDNWMNHRRLDAKPSPRSTLIAGAVSGLSLLMEFEGNRKMIALYSLVRLAHCIYASKRDEGKITPVRHGDSLLFALSSAQIMYAFVMRPDTLPKSFFEFMYRLQPVDRRILEAVRLNNRGDPIDLNVVNSYVSKASSVALKGADFLSTSTPDIIPCTYIHPSNLFCNENTFFITIRAFQRILPQYISLAVVPVLVLQLKSLIKNPLGVSVKTAFSILRSSAFIAAFVGIYQRAICVSRQFLSKDFRFVYWLCGFVCSASIFIERPSRRVELALYVIPRGLDAFFQQLVSRNILPNVPFFDVMLNCAAMSGLMYYFIHDKQHLAWLIKFLFGALFQEKSESSKKHFSGRAQSPSVQRNDDEKKEEDSK
eukprot:TRINITY_DN7298_c0_g1_i1.p1 TRINITY_DN7298_c0_g1~~TRINITY_DN7298_c0_g1_i1.p1  ORF type:complete len:531 (+),score=125.39 TRINITY_DN7298_c0_g1_i1:180-1772(+)